MQEKRYVLTSSGRASEICSYFKTLYNREVYLGSYTCVKKCGHFVSDNRNCLLCTAPIVLTVNGKIIYHDIREVRTKVLERKEIICIKFLKMGQLRKLLKAGKSLYLKIKQHS